MEYVAIAYVLIAVILGGYGINLRQKMQAASRERRRLESKED